MEKEKKISERHRQFADAWLVSKNATVAYSHVYPTVKRESAWREGSRLLRNVEVQKYIQARLVEFHMTADEVMARLSDQANATLHPFIKFDDDGKVYFDFNHPEAKANLHLIKKLKTKRVGRQKLAEGGTEKWTEEWVEVELHDAQAALKLIGQKHKIFSDRMEVVHTLNVEGLEDALTKIYGNKK